jgi:hypothetical protein
VSSMTVPATGSSSWTRAAATSPSPTPAAICRRGGQGSRLTPAMARDLAAALERFADYADGATLYVLTERT